MLIERGPLKMLYFLFNDREFTDFARLMVASGCVACTELGDLRYFPLDLRIVKYNVNGSDDELTVQLEAEKTGLPTTVLCYDH